MLTNFIATVKAVANDSYNEIFTTLKHKIAKLHALTKYGTFYEFFNLSENCSDSDIKKAFRRLKKIVSGTPSGSGISTGARSGLKELSKDQFDELVMYGYSLLVNYRKAYDGFLRDSKFLYIDEPINYKNYAIVMLIAVIFFLVFLDFVVYSLKYLKFQENITERKKNEDKAKASTTPLNSKKAKNNEKPPTMVANRLYTSAANLFARKN